MSSQTVMAMKEATDLTWSQLRQQKRFLKEAGLSLPNEQEQRKAMLGLTNTFATDFPDFVDITGNTHNTPLVRVKNISDFVKQLLDQYKTQGTLTWHNSIIPHDEVWVKFGGDHGKDSLRFTLQIANTDKPNSK
ncbi:amine oxidase [Plakobranchus ocellatus]|uniref:Amine oxidase n=1 Tax=Plakobranchus ocellatus TaxID=259542 RepID=A0AAV4AH61_9GAST|nr:amine oxidase [Plakobranchus ocellatus]